MDQLRDEFPRLGEALGGSAPDDCDEPFQELPPALGQPERRMQARAYSFWAGLLRGRDLPSISDCDPDRARDFEANSVVLDVRGGGGDPKVRSLGVKLAEQCGIDSPVARLSDVPEDSLLAAIADHTGQSLTSRAPFGFESEFVNQRGAMILYRGILLPFSSDEREIDFLLCAVNWKEVADPGLAAALHREIHRAVTREQLPVRGDGPLTEWADGPATGPDADTWAPIDEPIPSEIGEALEEAATPAELLAAAREMARTAYAAERRARELRDAAIGAAFDLSLAVAQNPNDFAGLRAGAPPRGKRAPMNAIAALVFGSKAPGSGDAGDNEAALACYADALAHGHRLALGRGALRDLLATTPGGLEGVIAAERRLRRREPRRRV